MTYEEALAFWFGRVNFELKSPNPDELKLDRMRRLLTLLGEPQERFRIIHVAGSKGKGSTAAMLAAILAKAGLRAGLFTSPHLVQVEERIQVDRQLIGRIELIAILEEIRAISENESWDGSTLAQLLTFFEIATAVGFQHFAQERVDVAVVEVGLGGRFDSTNVCNPFLSVLTSISYDHTQILGGTLTRIAREKAGIVKPGRPVVSGVRGGEARAVIEAVCREQAAPLRQLDVDFFYRHAPALFGPNDERPTQVDVTVGNQTWPGLRLGLIGEHQAANAAVAVAAVVELRRLGLAVSEQAVANGLATVNWPARLQIVQQRPWMILDCAHNVASAQALVDALRESFPLSQNGKRLLLFAGSKDKDLAGMLQKLTPFFDQVMLTRFTNTRSEDPEVLLRLLPPDMRSRVQVFHEPGAALLAIRALAQTEDLVCLTGSVFLAGELLPMLANARDIHPL